MRKILFAGILFLGLPLMSFAQWDDCVHGKTDSSCEAPGECGIYVYTDQNAICDHSQESLTTLITNEIKSKTTAITNTDINKNITEKSKTQTRNYPLFVITIIVTILYGITHILAQNKIITVLIHRKIWNSIMTIVFFATSVLGILIILQINSGKSFGLPFDLLYWHVVTGIVMMVIALFHIGWHWRYYKNLFKK